MIPVIEFRTNFHIAHSIESKDNFNPMVEIVALTAKPKYTFPECKEIKKEFEITEQRMFLERRHIEFLIEILKNCDVILERDEHYMKALINTIERDKKEDNEQTKAE